MLIIHLGMTGNLGFFSPDTPLARHDHVSLLLDDGLELRYNDTRRFGSLYILPAPRPTDIESTFFKAPARNRSARPFHRNICSDLAQRQNHAGQSPF